jgi:uncharacterized protein YjbJ (UPF0337 family)
MIDPCSILKKKEPIMTGKTDIVKGRIKEAVGALTGNEKLRAEGKSDQAMGEVKQAAQKVVDDVVEAAHTTVVKAQEAAQKAVAKAKDVAT